jgi:Tol biopolymer transport system component
MIAKEGTRVKRALVSALAAGLLAALATPSWGAQARTRLASKTSSGASADADSFTYDESAVRFLSADGRFVAFHSAAPNLPGPNDGDDLVYVHDRKTGRTRLVSVNSSGQPANGSCVDPSISANGRYVAFTGYASNLPRQGQPTSFELVYVHDRKTDTTKLVSKNSQGNAANLYAFVGSISGNGRFVAFRSSASNLPGQTMGYHTYVHDRVTRKTRLVSVNNRGDPAEGGAETNGPSLSNNGRFVVFSSSSDNLPGSNGFTHVYRHDRETRRTRLMSVTSQGDVADQGATDPGISGNGRFVTFESHSDNLGGDPGYANVFVHDAQTGRTRLVNRTSSGEPATGGSSEHAHPSGSGRYIVFASSADNLPGSSVGGQHIYVRDRMTGTTKLVSRSNGGGASNGDHYGPSISLDGRFAGFYGHANNLPGATGDYQVYTRGPLA